MKSSDYLQCRLNIDGLCWYDGNACPGFKEVKMNVQETSWPTRQGNFPPNSCESQED